MKAIYLLLTLILLSGCKPALKTAYGIESPKLEDDQSINKYLADNEVNTSNVYVFNGLMAFAIASQNNLLTIPDAMFFNKQGNFVPYKESASECNANADKFLLDLKAFDSAPDDPTKKIDDVFRLLKPAGAADKADVNVMITFAKHAGRLNKTKAFEWVKLIEDAKSKGVAINYYLINCDFQKSWNLTDDQKKSFGIKE